jgi:uncharacterized protein YgbK (DUF1537 family)
MPAPEVAILADDLTGALDAAAPFARPERPVAVVWSESASPACGSFALDSETRELPAGRAEAIVDRLLPCLASRPVALKKVDSLLRGNTLGELTACWRSGLFRSIVVAPAFPAQARVTRGGTQFARVAGEWQPLVPNLAVSLRDRGLPARTIGKESAIAGEGLLVCDAETEEDMEAIAAARPRLIPPVLWCGSSGIAHALAASPGAPVALQARRRLIVVGTRHPVSVAQADALAAARPDALVLVSSSADIAGLADRTGDVLDRIGTAALVFRLPPLAPGEVAEVARQAFAALAGMEAPDLLVATGGETLMRLCNALGASRLDALGEWRPGIPVARMADGAWSGTMLVSKSGAYGTADVLTVLATAHGASTL